MGRRDYHLDVKVPDTVLYSSKSEHQEHLHVSLKYWHSRSQCFSEWQKNELKHLTKLIDKVQELTEISVKTDAGLKWKTHKGPPVGQFSKPTSLPTEHVIGELRANQKARVHGFLHQGTFFVVWLDRKHEVFPER